MKRCKCGKRIAKHATECIACSKARRDAQKMANQAILEKGVCPDCGRKLKRNLALTGWIQCVQYGAEGFRAEPDKPACNFQMFV